MSKESLKIGELVVLDFRTEHLTDAISGWRNRTHVPYAESCARQVWYGDSSTFSSFPIKNQKQQDYAFYEGVKGYEFLMKLNLGLLSKKQAEVNIKGQFYQGWEKAQKEQPLSRQGYYDRFVEWVKADTRLVHNSILKDFKRLRTENSARDLSGMQRNEQILILGTIKSNGEVSSRSDGMVRVFSSNTGRKVSEIAVTHPDKDKLKILFEHFSNLKERDIINVNLTKVDFDDLPLAVDLYDRVFVDTLAEDDAETNRKLVSAWKDRQRRDNVIVHMDAPARMVRQWTATFRDDSYVSPKDIDRDMGVRARKNREVVEKTERAVKVIADLRALGKQPSKRMLMEVAPELGLS